MTKNILKSYTKEWRRYKALLDSGQFRPNMKARFSAKTSGSIGFSAGQLKSVEQAIERRLLFDLLKDDEPELQRTTDLDGLSEEALFRVGMELINAARSGDYESVQKIAKSGFDVNFVDPRTGNQAIHEIACMGSRRLVRAFIEAQNIDFHARDPMGRLPSEIAMTSNRDKVIRRFFRIKESAGEPSGDFDMK